MPIADEPENGANQVFAGLVAHAWAGKKAQVAAMESVAMGRVYELRDGLRGEHPGKM